MGTNASILLLITLWASVQDGENLLTFRMIFLVRRMRHDVSGKFQILVATLQNFSFVCFEKHIALIFDVHVPATRSVVLTALCTLTSARALSSTREQLPPNTLLMLRPRNTQHMEGLIYQTQFISERIFTAAKY